MADDFENIKLVNKMTNLIMSGNDLVIPTRFMPGGKSGGRSSVLVLDVGSAVALTC